MSTPTATDTPFTREKSQTAANQIHAHLREQILRLAIVPGTELSRQALTAFYGVSNTPVRDALLRLQEEGLVDVLPQHGTRVRTVDIDQARQAHFLRLCLELEIARKLAARHDQALAGALLALVDRQQARLAAQDLDGFVHADQEFHRRMFAAADMEDLWHRLRARSGNMDRLRRMHVTLNGKTDAVLQEHRDLVAAIVAGSPDAAEAVVRRHLGGTLSKLRALRERFPEMRIPEEAAVAVPGAVGAPAARPAAPQATAAKR